MEWKMKFLSLLLPVIVFAILSCAAIPNAYAPIDAGIRNGAFESALAHFDDEKGTARKSVYTSKNEILFYLDRGMVGHYAGLYWDSSRDLEMAERLIEEAFTKSISQEIGSYLLNDNVKNYSGEDYEDLYVNVFNSLNYYHNNDLEGALVEIRRMNEKLQHLGDKYEKAKEKVLESNNRVDPRQLPMEASRFSNSALARYLGVLFYRGAGKDDDARIDYEELVRAYGLAPAVYKNPLPFSAGEELSIPVGKGRLNVIAFTGLSPVKEEENIIIPLPFAWPNNTARLALPKMVDRSSDVLRAEAVLDSGEKFTLELIEDMSAVARETFKSGYGLTVLKTSARAITKAAAIAVSAQATSEKNSEGLGSLVGFLGRVATEATEQADTRISRYFPSYALAGGINVNPGKYTVTVNFYGKGGLVHSENKEMTARENTLNLEEFVCLK
jgi:hypothetical protein